MGITVHIAVDATAIRKNRKNVRENVGGYMTREEAIEILEEVKVMDDSMYAYDDSYMTALDMAISALKENVRLRDALKQRPRESRAKVPCICGSRKRETWLSDAGWQFKCMKCGRRSPWGKTEKEAIQNWNKMIEGMRVKQDGN